MKSVVHVNRQHIAMNAKDGGNRPVFTIKQKGKTRYAKEVRGAGSFRFVNDGAQLKCGARVWFEFEGDLELVGECSFREARG